MPPVPETAAAVIAPDQIARVTLATAILTVAVYPLQQPEIVNVAGHVTAAQTQSAQVLQYQGVAAPVRTVAETTPLTWQPKFPDGFTIAPIDRSTHTEAFAPSFPVPPLGWEPTYPDRAPGARPLADWLTQARNLLPITLTTDQFAWRGWYPDWLPLQRPAHFPAHATGATPSAFPLPAPLVWKGTYPDFAARDRQRVAETVVVKPATTPAAVLFGGGSPSTLVGRARTLQYQAVAAPVRVPAVQLPPLTWQPKYPDRFYPTPQTARLVQPQYHFVVDVAVPVMSWTGSFPDVVARKRETPVVQVPFVRVQPVDVATFGWRGRHPDTIPVKPRIIPPFLAQELPKLDLALLAWEPSYPDRIWTLRAPDFPAWTTGSTASVFPVPSLAWEPVYPDRVPGRTPLADWLTTALHPFPLTIPVDQYGWRGRYPDWFPPVPRTPGSFGLTLAPTVLVPFSDAIYPDWFPPIRLREFPATTSGATSSTFPVATFEWQPTYPDYVLAERVPTESWPAFRFDPFPILLTTDRYGWRGSYPDWLPLRRPAEFLAWVTGLTASSLLPPPLTWEPIYPDRIDPARGVVAPPFAAFHPSPVQPQVPTLPESVFPDLVARASAAVMGGTVGLGSPLVTTPFADVVFVDFVARQVAPLTGGSTGLGDVPLAFGWQPDYPDLLPARPIVVANAFVIGQRELAPLLSWLGRYPDRVPRATRLPDWLSCAWSEYELFRPASPTLAWRGTWPDMAPGRPPLPVGAMPFLFGFRPLLVPGPQVMKAIQQFALMPRYVTEIVLLPSATRATTGWPRLINEDTSEE